MLTQTFKLCTDLIFIPCKEVHSPSKHLKKVFVHSQALEVKPIRL